MATSYSVAIAALAAATTLTMTSHASGFLIGSGKDLKSCVAPLKRPPFVTDCPPWPALPFEQERSHSTRDMAPSATERRTASACGRVTWAAMELELLESKLVWPLAITRQPERPFTGEPARSGAAKTQAPRIAPATAVATPIFERMFVVRTLPHDPGVPAVSV